MHDVQWLNMRDLSGSKVNKNTKIHLGFQCVHAIENCTIFQEYFTLKIKKKKKDFASFFFFFFFFFFYIYNICGIIYWLGILQAGAVLKS